MAGLLVHTFDIPVATDPATQRSVQFAYPQGLLTGVSSGALTYGTLSYYPNLLVSQVVHRNGVIETQGNDPNEIRRPSSLAATGPFPGWSSGPYAYDGAGNIKTIGTASFTYDAVNRLVGSTQFDGPTGGGTPKQQGYTFDAFGNLTSITGTSGRNTPTDPQINRLTGSSLTTYDAAGNLTAWNGATYQYDEFNQMVHMQSPPESWAYLYTADDERLWSYDLVRNLSHWTVRDLGAQVLRDYLNMGGTWSVATDYIYRDGLLLAAETQTGQRHFHLDHLGTPRLITRAGGEKVAYHVYYPFGEEATVYNQDIERMKFTGHERDLASPSGPGDDLDYMHARHESPMTGRFLSVDPALESAEPGTPQTWNRYSYVAGNPLKYIDPTGEILNFFGTDSDIRKLERVANRQLHGVHLVVDQNGRASLVSNGDAGAGSPQQQAFANTLADAINRPQTINIGVTHDDSGITFGQYTTGTIDIGDIAAAGNGAGANSVSILSHEIAEQTAKQSMGLGNNGADFDRAHQIAVAAQNATSGYNLVSQTSHLSESLTGNIVGVHQKGDQIVTVTFQFVNGNLVRVTRRP
jgi:RHS repeat-associated protein